MWLTRSYLFNPHAKLAIIAGLAIGAASIILISSFFRPNALLLDNELIDKTKEMPEVQHFLATYPEAKPRVERSSEGGTDIISVIYALKKDVYEHVGLEGGVRELALIVRLQGFGDGIQMHIRCGGPITGEVIVSSSVEITKESFECLEPRIADVFKPRLSREQVLEISKVDARKNLAQSNQIYDFKEEPGYVLLPEYRQINPLVYVAKNGTHFLIDETNNYSIMRSCDLSDQNLCYTGDRGTQPYIIGHLIYVLDVTWKENEFIGGGNRYIIDGITGRILQPPYWR